MELGEGEVIEQIEQLDEGWWSGIGAHGTKQGLFPGMCFGLFDRRAMLMRVTLKRIT